MNLQLNNCRSWGWPRHVGPAERTVSDSTACVYSNVRSWHSRHCRGIKKVNNVRLLQHTFEKMKICHQGELPEETPQGFIVGFSISIGMSFFMLFTSIILCFRIVLSTRSFFLVWYLHDLWDRNDSSYDLNWRLLCHIVSGMSRYMYQLTNHHQVKTMIVSIFFFLSLASTFLEI